MVWFRINIGRERNADPRWLIPLICRAGGITKAEIGTIRIDDRKTRFQIAADFADSFDHATRTAKKKEGHIVRETNEESNPTRAAEGTREPFEAARPADTDTATPSAARPSTKSKSGKPRWRDKDKPKSEGWAPRRRHTPPGTTGQASAATSQGNGKAKKKSRPQP